MPRALEILAAPAPIPLAKGQEIPARTFYGQYLGLRETMRQPGETGLRFVGPKGTVLVLVATATLTHSTDVKATILVDDAETLRRALTAKRYRVHDTSPLEGHRRFLAVDPSGNRVEIRQKVA
ncbi:MAG TPA: VOC family protein [Candidatus Thermoplasmatota archaeon]|nr:VOC family protein [Candidatus Thermoplasmatota archaeon]